MVGRRQSGRRAGAGKYNIDFQKGKHGKYSKLQTYRTPLGVIQNLCGFDQTQTHHGEREAALEYAVWLQCSKEHLTTYPHHQENNGLPRGRMKTALGDPTRLGNGL